jgi:Mrp family chromosome partitioning ATPase
LLASDDARRFVEEAKREYDLVIFDLPPALAVADIDGFAARLDAVLLLVKSGKLSRGVVGHAVRKLEQVGANLVGSVLNAARPTRNEQKYGYGYGYGYGSKHAA